MSKKSVKIGNLRPLDEDERDDASYRGRDRAWSALVAVFDRYNSEEGLTYEALGKRIQRSKSQVQRWLSSSYNMNLKSLGLLAEGLDSDLVIDVRPRTRTARGVNYCHPQEAAQARLDPLSLGSSAGTNVSTNYRFTSAETAQHAGSSNVRVHGLKEMVDG